MQGIDTPTSLPCLTPQDILLEIDLLKQEKIEVIQGSLKNKVLIQTSVDGEGKFTESYSLIDQQEKAQLENIALRIWDLEKLLIP